MELTHLIEQISGSDEYKDEYDRLEKEKKKYATSPSTPSPRSSRPSSAICPPPLSPSGALTASPPRLCRLRSRAEDEQIYSYQKKKGLAQERTSMRKQKEEAEKYTELMQERTELRQRLYAPPPAWPAADWSRSVAHRSRGGTDLHRAPPRRHRHCRHCR